MKTLTNRFAHYAVSTFVLSTAVSQKLFEVTGLARLQHAFGRELTAALIPSFPYPTYEENLETAHEAFEMTEKAAHALLDGDIEQATKLWESHLARAMSRAHVTPAMVEEMTNGLGIVELLVNKAHDLKRSLRRQAA